MAAHHSAAINMPTNLRKSSKKSGGEKKNGQKLLCKRLDNINGKFTSYRTCVPPCIALLHSVSIDPVVRKAKKEEKNQERKAQISSRNLNWMKHWPDVQRFCVIRLHAAGLQMKDVDTKPVVVRWVSGNWHR